MSRPTLTVAPTVLDLRLYAGDGFTALFTFTQDAAPWPAGGVWHAQVREQWSDEVVALTFAVDTSEADTGRIRISLSGDQTRALFALRDAWWDLEQIDTGGEPRTWYRGRIIALEDITRV